MEPWRPRTSLDNSKEPEKVLTSHSPDDPGHFRSSVLSPIPFPIPSHPLAHSTPPIMRTWLSFSVGDRMRTKNKTSWKNEYATCPQREAYRTKDPALTAGYSDFRTQNHKLSRSLWTSKPPHLTFFIKKKQDTMLRVASMNVWILPHLNLHPPRNP